MTKHVLTKEYSILRGFSTDSKFVRPANVSDKDVNMMSLPDETFSPRRGYQVQEDEIGGLGISVYKNSDTNEAQKICIHKDGNLYIEKQGSMTISFNDVSGNPESYISYEIFVNPDTVSDTQSCDFDPYQVVDDNALITDQIMFRLKKLTGVSGESIGTGSTTYSGYLSDTTITPGSILITDGTIAIQDDSINGFFGDIGVGTNTIDYITGAYSITLSGVSGALTASYKTTLQEEFNQSLGKGFGVSSPYTITSLSSLLSIISGVSITTTGSTNQPAAFLNITEETNIANGKSVTLTWVYWEAANRTAISTFQGLVAKLSDDDFRIATFAAYEEAVYIASRFDEVQKYDGQTIYRAGMPQGTTPSPSDAGSGTGVDLGSHNYYITYEQIDNNGRLIEGRLSDAGNVVLAAPKDVNVTVTNLLQGSGWNTNGAVVVGVQNGVTIINVDDGVGSTHSLRVGDTAYFFDGVTSDYVTREITETTANTITIAGDAVNVTDNISISNNLKINLFRTVVGGTTPHLVTTLPNNSYSGTQVFKDSISDATVVNQRDYLTPVRQSDPPPKSGIVVAFGNQLIFTQDDINEDYVWFSEPANPEYVPSTNNFILPGNDDDVTGAGISGSTLIIFKNKSIYAVSGDLITSQFTVTSISPGSNIGCVSHHTIVSIGGMIYFTHRNGVYTLVETVLFPTDKFGNPIPVSITIDKLFREEDLNQDKRFVLNRATAVHYNKDRQYLLFIPSEESTGVKAANNNSRVLCYSTIGKDWFEWTRINAAGGWAVIGDDLFWQERRKKNSTITAKTYKQHRKYRLIDQVDHVTPIRVTWESSWEDAGQPRTRKKFIRSILLFDEISAIFQQNIPTLCFFSYKDWVDGAISTRADIMQKIQSSKWNTDHWSWIRWSGYQDSFITIPLKGGTVAKSLKIGLQLNQINSSFRLQGFQQEISNDFGKTVSR